MEFNDQQAIYLQIADLFLENILRKKWLPGDRIPSVREMAVSIEVNPNTVMRTYNHLQDLEVIYNKRGIGFFVADNGYQTTQALRKQDFLKQDLPKIFKEMQLLDLTIEDLNEIYNTFNKEAEESAGIENENK